MLTYFNLNVQSKFLSYTNVGTHFHPQVSSVGLRNNDLVVVRAGRHAMVTVRHFTHAASGDDGSGGARSSQQQQRVVKIAMCEHDDLVALRDR